MNRRLITLFVILLAAAVALPSSAQATAGPSLLQRGDGFTTSPPMSGDEMDTYIVVFQAPPLATYQGGVAGLGATNPEALGETMLDPSSPSSQAYLSYLDSYQDARLAAMEAAFGRTVSVNFRYQAALNGVSVAISGDEAALAAALPEVVHVERQSYLELLTDRGPAWIEAEGIWDGSTTSGLPGTKGEGVVVGIIDTGINTDHPAFADIGPVDGYDHSNPRVVHYGLCAPLNPLLCNDKLIGLYDFTGTGPEDDVLHGSHVASTVAGNVLDATYTAPTASYSATISGVAPHANIISYKVCSSFNFPELGSCPIDALIAGIDQATFDVVDVINFSIGGAGFDPWTDPLAQAFFGARSAGIFAATSAGNAGPGPGTVGRPANAPWITSVAASTHDRFLANALVGMSGGAGAPPADIAGKSFTSGYGPAPIAYAGDYGDALCLSPFAAGTWTNGEIVVCDRGTNGRAEKAANAAAGGAGGYVLANDAASGGAVVADSYVIPGVHISYSDGLALKAWLAGGSGHTASIAGTDILIGPEHGDVMAGFSSRGPNAAPDVLKPDVTAPGVDILAAFHTPDPANPGPDEYGIISGTSMSSPHVAGAGALLRALHPDWTPDQIKSALMTTAFTTPAGGKEVQPVLKEDGATPADPFDMGAGRIDLSQAGQAGLLLDELVVNYQSASPDLGGDPTSLNLPSIANSACDETCSWTRNLEGAAAGPVTWTTAVQSGGDMALSVSPTSFTLSPEQTQAIQIHADVTAVQPKGSWVFGEITLIPNDPTVPQAHLPVAVFAAGEAIQRTTLHMHGNQHDGCTGDGATDITVCDGPTLEADPVMDGAPAASWGPIQARLSGGSARTIYDPNWIWHLDNATTLEGPMTVEWWYSCPNCNLALSDDFFIRLWADGALVVEERLRYNVAVPGIPRLLKATVSIPNITAGESFVLHVDPVFINQDGSFIYYDSTQACPGGSAAPCDSRVKMPVVGTGPEPPVTGPPLLHPVSDDADPDWADGVDQDGSYSLSWDAPAAPATAVCTYLVEEATAFGTPFFDDAEEALVLGSNSTWTGDPEWHSAAHPNTGTQGYSVLYGDNLNTSLSMAAPLALPAGVNATLSFESFENTETGFDFVIVEASGDGGPYTALTTHSGLFSGVRTIDLSGYAGQSVSIRFRLTSDTNLSFGLGWMIDDIRIDVDDFSPIATVGGATLAYDVNGRTDGTYHYRIGGLFGDCAASPVQGPYSNVESVTVAIPEDPEGGTSATGGGWLATLDGKKLNFGFNASGGDAPQGNLQLNDKGAGVKIHISSITSVGGVSGSCGSVPAGENSLEFAGDGTYNGAAASFRVCVQDNGEPGSADLFHLDCTSGCSYSTGDRTADDLIDGGNIQVVSQASSEDSGGTGPQGSSQATTIVLDPLLQTQGVIGQAQTFSAVVYDQFNQPMSNVSVTLASSAPGGSLTALTGLDGIAVFTTLNLSGTVEYIASVSGLQSNAIELDGILP